MCGQNRKLPFWLEATTSIVTAVAIVVGSGAAVWTAREAVKGNIVTRPRTETVTGEVTAIIPGTDFPDNEWWVSLPKYDAPQLPDEAAGHEIDDVVSCSDGYVPIAASAIAHTGWPDNDVMYTVNAGVRDGKIILQVRSRRVHYWTEREYTRGYAYIRVLVHCELDI